MVVAFNFLLNCVHKIKDRIEFLECVAVKVSECYWVVAAPVPILTTCCVYFCSFYTTFCKMSIFIVVLELFESMSAFSLNFWIQSRDYLSQTLNQWTDFSENLCCYSCCCFSCFWGLGIFPSLLPDTWTQSIIYTQCLS